MRTVLFLLLAPMLLASLAHADPDDLSGGVFIVHAPPSLTYTGSPSWCDSTHLTACEDQVTSIPTDSSKTVVWFILSAWSEAKSFTAVEFGLGGFDPGSFFFSESGPCLDHAQTLYHGDWPGPYSGVAVATNTDPWTGQLFPIYWFAGISYATADNIPLTTNPATGFAGWISGQSRLAFPAHCLGGLGIGVPGVSCCPESTGVGGEDSVEEPDIPGQDGSAIPEGSTDTTIQADSTSVDMGGSWGDSLLTASLPDTFWTTQPIYLYGERYDPPHDISWQDGILFCHGVQIVPPLRKQQPPPPRRQAAAAVTALVDSAQSVLDTFENPRSPVAMESVRALFRNSPLVERTWFDDRGRFFVKFRNNPHPMGVQTMPPMPGPIARPEPYADAVLMQHRLRLTLGRDCLVVIGGSYLHWVRAGDIGRASAQIEAIQQEGRYIDGPLSEQVLNDIQEGGHGR